MSVRIRGTIDTDAKTFSFYLDIPNHGAGQGAICGGNTHVPEQFSWLIMEQGVWDDIEAGKRALEKAGEDSTYVSGWFGGEPIEAVERDFAEYIGVEHAVTSNSGTSAIHVAGVGAARGGRGGPRGGAGGGGGGGGGRGGGAGGVGGG